MNRENREKANRKMRDIWKKRKKTQGADAALKRALKECMEQEAAQMEEKNKAKESYAFSQSFIERMQFVLKQGKAAEEQQKKQARRRKGTRVAAACIVCVVVAGGSWIGLQGSLRQSQNDMTSSGAKTEKASAEENLEIAKADQGNLDDEKQNVSGALEDETASFKQKENESESSQESAGTEDKSQISGESLAQEMDVKVLTVTPTSLEVRLTNNGDEDISFGDDYEGIEVYDEATDTWMECQKQYEIACHDILHFVKSGDKQNWFDWYVDWTNVYGSLGAGHYRLLKNISIGNIDGGDQYVQLIQIEFDVR